MNHSVDTAYIAYAGALRRKPGGQLLDEPLCLVRFASGTASGYCVGLITPASLAWGFCGSLYASGTRATTAGCAPQCASGSV
jgi:hypothetical protein